MKSKDVQPVGCRVRSALMPASGPLWKRLTIYITAAAILGIVTGNVAQAVPEGSIPVILISVDTLRANHLSCYGYQAIRTPNICQLSEGGTLFTQVSSQYPLTLPSHVSMLTSTYPFVNGVIDNGEVLPAGAITLARVMKAHGYRTAAFIGGFVLDSRFGLNQGFEYYNSPFNVNQGPVPDIGDVKRLGEKVVQSASLWLDKNSKEPFFAFIHLYDLHTPYSLPRSFTPPAGATSYDAEISYIDAILGRLWGTLDRLNLSHKVLIVFTADHGEGLGQHGEGAHGYFIYQSTLRVPLIIHWPAELGMHVKEVLKPVSLIDIAPTILQIIGLGAPPQFQGHSLLSLTTHPTDSSPWHEKVFAESLYGHMHFDVAPLRSIRVGRYKYIDAPKPELYDLKDDPNETHNLWSEKRDIASVLGEQLGSVLHQYQVRSRRIPNRVSPEVAARLSSLGYTALSSPEVHSNDHGVDPKDRIEAFNEYNRALFLSARGQLEKGCQILQQLLAQDPRLSDVRISLGLTLQRQGHQAAAADEFRRVLARDPLNSLAHFDLGISYGKLNRVDDAIKEFEAAVAIAPYYTRAEEMLGNIELGKGNFTAAQTHYEKVLKYNPNDFTAHYNLGAMEIREGKWDPALVNLKAAVKADPRSVQGHNVLGSYYFLRGDITMATKELIKAVQLDPHFAQAHYNLGLVFQKQSQYGRAEAEFKSALQINPQFAAAREALNSLGKRP